ncbi:hypothetical protein HYPSUDRAFT_48612 [Hypholoma sublateritium FD-334 SS-4]|uniref:N-acetyltransferase domain-containing protein n=1 Tax=Hypholoma sublateritium (strain FD-334 SS-4) TaxID=945553 RepID=A0A0D2N7W1_HYPSF|nr:hypothetical protein HYPSUDRAFT_48612 [Hypholoma sublateritium FD-334 SS-4]
MVRSERQQEQGAKELFRLLQEEDPPLFKWWTETFIPSLGGFANRHMDAAPGENVKTSNWTLYSLSVHPDYQGQGISRLLVKAGEDQAKAQNLRTIFEASEDKNVAIYKRLGYEEKGLEHVDGPPGLPGYNMHLMGKTPV